MSYYLGKYMHTHFSAPTHLQCFASPQALSSISDLYKAMAASNFEHGGSAEAPHCALSLK